MQFCDIQNKGINDFWEYKIKYKARYMFLHTCCCILIFVMSGFDKILKEIQNPLKINLEKEKEYFYFSLPLLSFQPNSPGRPAPPPL